MTNKQFQAIIKELFIGCRKLNSTFAFITQSYFTVPKRIHNKRELQNIDTNHSADINHKDVMKN